MRAFHTALAALARPDYYVDRLSATRDYLAAWPEEKVIRVHSQCTALRSAGLPLAPELLELDLFLFLAGARLAEFKAVS